MSITFDIMYRGKQNHVGQYAAPITGEDTIQVTKEIMKSTPREYVLSQVESLSIKRILDGNLNFKISDCYARKLRSRGLSAADFHTNDYFDLLIREELETKNKFIQKVYRIPFFVIFLNEDALMALAKLKREILFSARYHLDATGSVVRQFELYMKTFYFYSLCIRVPAPDERGKGSLIEIASMVSASHSQITIGEFLGFVKIKLYDVLKDWPIFKHVVTDFSFATMNAVLLNLNSISFIDYINMKFAEFAGKVKHEEDSVNLHTCVAHLMKNFSSLIKKHRFAKQEAVNLKKMFGILCKIRTWTNFKTFLELLIMITTSEKLDDFSKRVLENINEISTSYQLEEAFLNLEFDEEEFTKHQDFNQESETHFKTIYQNSKFHKFAMELLEARLQSNLDSDRANAVAEKNPYYNMVFLKEFFKKFIAFAPLWININDTNLQVIKYFNLS